MASPDPRKVIRGLTGSLCTDPTDLDAAFPHGGTAIGLTRDMVFTPGERAVLIHAEEFGNVVREGFRVQDSPVFTAVLRQWDDDGVAAIYPDTATGDSGRTLIRSRANTNANRSGTKLSASAVKLLFSPDSPDQHPFIIIYKAIPVLTDSMIEPDMRKELGFSVGFYGIPDASYRLAYAGFRADISL